MLLPDDFHLAAFAERDDRRSLAGGFALETGIDDEIHAVHDLARDLLQPRGRRLARKVGRRRDQGAAQSAQQQAAEQQQAMAAAQQVQNLTGAAKNLGQATVGPDGQTALEAIIGGMGGM